MKTKAEQMREWKDPRSVAFRGAIRGWAFSNTDGLRSRISVSRVHAWLPEHHRELAKMEEILLKETNMKTRITETECGYDLHIEGRYIATWRSKREAELDRDVELKRIALRASRDAAKDEDFGEELKRLFTR